MRYIIFDLDDTLLNNQRRVTDYTLDVLHRMQKMGHKLVINTARSKAYSQEYFDRIRPDYAILNGGAQIVDGEGTTIFRAELDADKTQAVVDDLLKLTENITVQTEAVLYSHRGLYTGQNAVAFDFDRERVSFSALKIVASLKEEKQAGEIAEKYALEYTSYLSGTFWRFNHPDATKAKGNRNLMKLVGGTPVDVIAFGDDLGDLEMLQQAGIGVLMKNAEPRYYGTCSHITDFTNDEDGVARFLAMHFGLE
ncbi:MAG: HAD-IIB family hydrolase [Ruminococcaceae bacterium]|nr:HAD-IIB family hydrolase [Oscillospiraceae bacterium]